MIIPVACLFRRGVTRLGGGAWQARDADPQFFFRPQRFGAAYLIIDLIDADHSLDPCLYIDSGAGFKPEGEISLRQGRGGIYIVDVRSFERVCGVRFDPATSLARFKMRAYFSYSAKSTRAFVGARLHRSAQSGATPQGCEIVAGDKRPSLLGIGSLAQKTRTVGEHFNQLVALAALQSAPIIEDLNQSASPFFSFLCPVYNTPPLYLDQLLHSFQAQQTGLWELILSDDCSTAPETIAWLEQQRDVAHVRIVRGGANGGIARATNAGLAVAQGEWIGLIDHDDALAPFALEQIARAAMAQPNIQFLYTDEVITDAKLRPQGYFFKPAYDPVLLSGINYINHVSLFKRARLRALGGWRTGFDGSQDYDLLLRYLKDLPDRAVLHVPYPAYLWRRDGASYSVTHLARATNNARQALSEAYAGDADPALVEAAFNSDLHRVRLDNHVTAWPLISIVIPNKDSVALMARLIDDLTQKTDYPHIEIIIVDNGSTDPQILALYETWRREIPRFHVDITPAPFNFSRQINRGLRLAQGEAVLLLNNDVEVMTPDWLREMASCLAYDTVGVVGARLLYPDGSLQHAGVIVGLGSVAGHWFCEKPVNEPGPMGRLQVRQSFSAVTGACMLISRQCFDAVGFLDERKFAIAYNDVDYCLRAGLKGFRTVWTPFATLRHHESLSRGSDETPANITRFHEEQENLRQAYALADFDDPAYSPWYTRNSSTPYFCIPMQWPEPRLWESALRDGKSGVGERSDIG